MSAPAENARPAPAITTARLDRTSSASSAVAQLALDLGRDRVQLLVAVEAHDRDCTVALDRDEAHRSTSLISPAAASARSAHVVETLARQPVLRAPHADDRDRPALLRQHRSRRAEERLLELADARRIARAPHLRELRLERLAVGDRRRA